MTIRFVAFDLDGTLMGEDLKIRPRVRRAITRAQELDVMVTLATGRMFSATVPFARCLNIDATLICYQGGWIQALDGPIVHRAALAQEHAHAALALGRAHGWHTILYADGELFIDDLRHPRRFYHDLLGPNPKVEPDLERILKRHTPDKVLFVGAPETIPTMAETLLTRFDGIAEVLRSHRQFVEVVPPGVSKGRALALLAEHAGIPREAVMAVGDQQNDLSMVSWAGVGVAMGNGVDVVREVADWVAPPLSADGAAVALERYLFRGDGL